MALYWGNKKVSLYLGDKRVKPSIGPSGGLPAGYTQLEYIQSTGVQYINTGISNWNNTLEYEIKLDIVQQTGTGTYSYFGAYNSWAAIGTSVPNIGTYFGYKMVNSFKAGQSTGAGTDIGIRNGQTGVISLKGDAVSWSEGSSLAFDRGSDFTNAVDIVLFAINSATGAKEFSKTKMYKATFWLNGAMVFNGIPAKRNSDNKIGMYDTVSETFLVGILGDFQEPVTSRIETANELMDISDLKPSLMSLNTVDTSDVDIEFIAGPEIK